MAHGGASPAGRAAVRSMRWLSDGTALAYLTLDLIRTGVPHHQADLGDLDGMANGLGGTGMIDGKDFDGAKAYKDSKVGARWHSGWRSCLSQRLTLRSCGV